MLKHRPLIKMDRPCMLIDADGNYEASTVGDAKGYYYKTGKIIIKYGDHYHVLDYDPDAHGEYRMTKLPKVPSGGRVGVPVVALATDGNLQQFVLGENPELLTDNFCFAILDGVVVMISPPTKP